LSTFDPDGPGVPGRLYGLPYNPDAKVRILPVPFQATTSFRPGTAGGPQAVLDASVQVDLWDPEVDSPWEEGIALEPVLPGVEELDARTRDLVLRVRDGDLSARAAVNDAGRHLTEQVRAWAQAQLQQGRIPGVLGGDHSVPLGAMQAAAEAHPGLGILHVDAHADLRPAYEGFTYSHASIFNNVMKLPVGPLVQVGIRDQGQVEARAQARDERIKVWRDGDLAAALAQGESWQSLVDQMLAPLPELVWISIDIDGLDPALCPNTGTPVPGGLDWHQVLVLLASLGRSGRRIVGFDLCEVGPEEWDATVGARLLYKLATWAIHTNRKLS
jgi:agmatinase